jgi:23S rRNA (adenine2503-C2)-methyltransferase
MTPAQDRFAHSILISSDSVQYVNKSIGWAVVRTSFYQYTLPELRSLFEAHELSPSAAGKLFNWHYKKGRFEVCEKDIAKTTLDFISRNLSFALPEIDAAQMSGEDRTVKFLFRLEDGKKIETVLIPSNKRYGICLSSQVGCAMKCSFCHTGLQGLERHLQTHEIVGQFLAAKKWLTENRPLDSDIATIVFMGQGEPLHNFDSVRTACEIFLSQHGLCLAGDKITISTAGYLPGLERWKDEMPDVNIALSLHSLDPEKRNELIPINKKYPVEKVLEVIGLIPRSRKRFVVFEYLLAKGFNDSSADARELAMALKEKRAFVNLIPFNPFPGTKYERPDSAEVDAFKAILDEEGIACLVRFTKGDDILAACGQLNSKT